MKRILVLSLALILVVSSMAVPSYAAESDYAVHDLLTAVEYTLTSGSRTSVSNAPNFWASPFNGSILSWNSPSFGTFNYIIVIAQFSITPTNFFIQGQSSRAYGELISRNGNLYQYKFTINGYIPEVLKFGVETSSTGSGDFILHSVVGYDDNTIELNNVSYFANAMMYDNGDGEGSAPDPDDFRWPVSVGSGNNVSLPVVVDFDGPTGSDFYSIDYGEVFLKVPFDSSFKYLNSVSFVIFTCGEISSFGSRLERSDGTFVAGLTSELVYCGETQMVFSLEEQFERIHSYIVTVDVEGYDLSSTLLTLQMNIPSVFGSYIYQYDRGFYFQCSSVVAAYDANVVPWYTNFAIWLETQYSSIKSSVSAGISSVVSSITSGVSSLVSGISTVNDSIVSWGSSIYYNMISKFNSVIDLLDPSADTDGFQDQVDDQGDRLDQMDDALSSVTKPALDRVDTNISGIVSDTDLANTAHVYTYIIDDNIMAPALTMVTILAMMSFALFGKR